MMRVDVVAFDLGEIVFEFFEVVKVVKRVESGNRESPHRDDEETV